MDRFHRNDPSSTKEEEFNPVRDKEEFFDTPNDDKIPLDTHNTGVKQNIPQEKRKFLKEILGSDSVELHKGPEQHPHIDLDEFSILSENKRKNDSEPGPE